MKKRLKSKVMVPHEKDCRACASVKRGDWDTPWSGIIKRTEYRDVLVRKHKNGHCLYYVISCNSTNCQAEKFVSAEVLSLA